jgi:drug/metabolite transporter (DMT)-like permease
MVNFFTDAVLAVLTGLYLLMSGSFRHIVRDVRKNLVLLLPMSIADKAAWVAFVFSMSLAPIAVATALSESYIIIAVILGLYVNREKIQAH